MSSLRAALAKATGHEPVQSSESTDVETMVQGLQARLIGQLTEASDINRFRSVAKRTLTEWPDLVDEVITQAKRFGEPGEKFAGLIESIREELATVPPRVRERFLNRTFNPPSK